MSVEHQGRRVRECSLGDGLASRKEGSRIVGGVYIADGDVHLADTGKSLGSGRYV